MEVKAQHQSHMSASEPGTMPFAAQSPANMRLAFTPDGTAVYKPITTTSPPYPGSGGGGGVDGQTTTIAQQSLNANTGEPMKRKRGRPRKYGPDGAMALALAPVSPSVPPSGGGVGGGGGSFSLARSPTSPTKKGKGRPAGSGKKQQMAALGNSLLVLHVIQFFPSCVTGFWFCLMLIYFALLLFFIIFSGHMMGLLYRSRGILICMGPYYKWDLTLML